MLTTGYDVVCHVFSAPKFKDWACPIFKKERDYPTLRQGLRRPNIKVIGKR